MQFTNETKPWTSGTKWISLLWKIS